METGLISPAGENLLYFTEFRQVLSTYDGEEQETLLTSLPFPLFPLLNLSYPSLFF